MGEGRERVGRGGKGQGDVVTGGYGPIRIDEEGTSGVDDLCARACICVCVRARARGCGYAEADRVGFFRIWHLMDGIGKASDGRVTLSPLAFLAM